MLGGLAVGLLLCLVLAGYALWQHLHTERLRERGRALFAELKKQEVRLAQLRRRVASSGAASLRTRLAALERQHRRQTAQYRGYVRELGVRRELSPKERVIYRVARLFGESEFGIPAGFVRKVKTTIRDYWGGPARDGFVRALRRAREQGYTELIVDTLRAHDLPPELFYLALQESRFDPEAVGPRTRWGIAKGLWQFIPKTARRYGLRLGPRVKRRVPDPKDERHDVRKATRAAADYLQAIYTTRAQASGLLVVASYNWGEHRVVEKMEALPGPQHLPEAALEGIPAEPSARTYWQFLTTYRDRMPAETKDYVLKVFAAAVIGQAPQRFGFSVENPIRRVLNARGNDGAGESAR
jgi:soluble lytic murein transglycosylase-like protein